jgi:hypothetical protein
MGFAAGRAHRPSNPVSGAAETGLDPGGVETWSGHRERFAAAVEGYAAILLR